MSISQKRSLHRLLSHNLSDPIVMNTREVGELADYGSRVEVQYDGRGKAYISGQRVAGKAGKYLEALYRP